MISELQLQNSDGRYIVWELMLHRIVAMWFYPSCVHVYIARVSLVITST